MRTRETKTCYLARKLERNKTNKQKLITALYWLFPLTLFWGGLKFCCKQLFGKVLGKTVLPARKTQVPHSKEARQYKNNRAALNKKLRRGGSRYRDAPVEAMTVITHDGVALDTLVLTPLAQPENPQDRTYVIEFLGSKDYYEKSRNNAVFDYLERARREIRENNCNYVLFNYRGVGCSTGVAQSLEDLITDALAQMQRLLDQGADPENIFFKGHSFGAAISTKAAKRAHDLGYKVRVYNDRSFAFLSAVAAGSGWLRLAKKAIFKLVLVLTGWEMDPGPDFMALPSTHRDYFCVRSSKADRKQNQQDLHPLRKTERPPVTLYDDAIIPHSVSIHRFMKPERVQLKRDLQKHQPTLSAKRIKDQVKMASNHHKMVTVLGVDGHTMAAKGLVSRCIEDRAIINAEQHFNAFFDRALLSTRKPPTAQDETIVEEKRVVAW